MIDLFQYFTVKLFGFLHIENPFIQQFIIALIFASLCVEFAKENTYPRTLLPGIIVHEISHVFFAKIFGFKIIKIKLLNFSLLPKKKQRKQGNQKKEEKQDKNDSWDNWDNWDNMEYRKNEENMLNKKNNHKKENYVELHPTGNISIIGAFFTFFSPLIVGVITVYWAIMLWEFDIIPAAQSSSNFGAAFLYIIIYLMIFYFLLIIIAGSEISKADLTGFIETVKTKPSLIRRDVGLIVLTLFLTPLCLNFIEFKFPAFFGLISNFYFINLISFFVLLIVIYFMHQIIYKIAKFLINLGKRIKRKVEFFIGNARSRLRKSSERFFRKNDRDKRYKNKLINDIGGKKSSFEFLEKFKKNIEDLDRLTKN